MNARRPGAWVHGIGPGGLWLDGARAHGEDPTAGRGRPDRRAPGRPPGHGGRTRQANAVLPRRRALLALAILLAVPVAAAHAEIASVEPPSGARLDAAPAMVRLELTQPVEPSNLVLTVTDQDGRRVDQGDVRSRGGDRPIITVSLQADLPDGAYLITLTATSLTDSHRITYTRSFAVGGFVPFETRDATEDVDGWSAAARAVGYAGLAVVLGAVVLGMRLGWPARLVLPVRIGAALHACAAAWLLLLMQAEAAQSWVSFASTAVGRIMLARAALAAAVLLVALALAPRNGQRGAGLGAVAVLSIIATARFTHASVRGPGAIANDALHIVAAGVWVGGLVLLLWLWLDARRDPLADARAFSTPALVAVIGIALTGIVAALLIVPVAAWRGGAALASPYGAFLAGKVALAAAMVAVAAVNRFVLLHRPGEGSMAWLRRAAAATGAAWLRPAHAAGAAPRQGLRRLVGIEAACGAAVLVLAGLLLSTSPPNLTGDETTTQLRVTGEGSDFLVTTIIDPAPMAGTSSVLRFFIQYAPDHPDEPDQPVRNATCGGSACIQAILTDENETLRENFVAHPEGDGWWQVDQVLWPRAGTFDLILRVSTDFVFQDDVRMRVVVA